MSTKLGSGNVSAAKEVKQSPKDRPGRAKPKALGRGLAALLGEAEGIAAGSEQVRSLPLAALFPSPVQPRRHFAAEALEELAASVRAHGVIQPLVVRPSAERRPGEAERFEIVAGERRWRAAQAAGLAEVPAVVRTVADRDALAIALVENLQREDLSPIEEAEAYRSLIEEHHLTQEALADIVGKSRAQVTNMLRLLRLPPAVVAMVAAGELSAGHARALVGAADAEALANRIVANQLSVRQAEALSKAPPAVDRLSAAKDPNLRAVEREIIERLGLKATLRPSARSEAAGTLTLHYKTLDQLDGVLELLYGRTT